MPSERDNIVDRLLKETMQSGDGACDRGDGSASTLAAFISLHAKRREYRVASVSAQAIDRITPIVNATVDQESGGMYELTARLAAKMSRLLDITREMENPDLAITCLMLVFARYYAHNQYPLLIDAFRCVPELERLERFVNEYGRRLVRLPVNMATDERYGLLQIADRIRANRQPIGLREFDSLLELMRVPGIRPEQFVNALVEARYHPRIVESFYMFTSITRESRVVLECRELSVTRRLVGFKFPRPARSCDAENAILWFTVPRGSIWFAYHGGRWTYQTYVGRDTDALVERAMRALRDIGGIVIGYLHGGAIYPVQFDGPMWSGRWLETRRQIIARALNSPYREPPISIEAERRKDAVFFVREGVSTVCRLTA